VLQSKYEPDLSTGVAVGWYRRLFEVRSLFLALTGESQSALNRPARAENIELFPSGKHRVVSDTWCFLFLLCTGDGSLGAIVVFALVRPIRSQTGAGEDSISFA
jgi:hypothetical protein